MEINFNTNGGKFAKHDSLMALAENVDKKGKAMAYLAERTEIERSFILDAISDDRAVLQGALRDLIELINDTLPSKYRPNFHDKASKIQQKVKRSYEQNDEILVEKLKQNISSLQNKYGVDK